MKLAFLGHIGTVAAIVLSTLPTQANPTSQYSYPITNSRRAIRDLPCYMLTGAGKALDLTRLCGTFPDPISTSSNSSNSSNLANSTDDDWRLVHSDTKANSYIKPSAVDVQNRIRKFWRRKDFKQPTGPGNQVVRQMRLETVSCDSQFTGSIGSSQELNYDLKGELVNSATGTLTNDGGNDEIAVISYVCRITKESTSTDFDVTTPGRCDFPEQLDAAGRRCGDRAASKKPGGKR